MKFTKMHGAGNDYVYINCFQEQIEHPEELARAVSNRHFGIGSDGLVLIGPSKVADFEMKMYNADGSPSEMCGNAIRCVGKYVYDYGLTQKTNITVETLAGIKKLDLILEGEKVVLVKVDMGAPILKASQIPMKVDKEQVIESALKCAHAGHTAMLHEPASNSECLGRFLDNPVKVEEEPVIDYPIQVNGNTFFLTGVSMGNPHAVLFVDDVDAFPIEEVGPHIEGHALFPNRVNTEFVKVINRNCVQMRVWERGSGETFACGTGACAAVVACVLKGLTDEEVTVKLLGGELQIHWDRNKGTVYMTGPAEVIYDGVYRLQNNNNKKEKE